MTSTSNPNYITPNKTIEEDILLLETRLSLGNKWSEIRKRLPGRTENNVKNRFNMMFKMVKEEYIKNHRH